jgi:hypothetical protein
MAFVAPPRTWLILLEFFKFPRRKLTTKLFLNIPKIWASKRPILILISAFIIMCALLTELHLFSPGIFIMSAARIAKSLACTLTLNDGVVMPLFGFGTYRLTDPTESLNTCVHALNIGHRLLDTAQFYE